MKKVIKALLILIALICSIVALAACGEPEPEPESSWTPQGIDVVLEKTDLYKYSSVYAEGDEVGERYATELKRALSEYKFVLAGVWADADLSLEKAFLLGNTSHAASKVAMEYLAESSETSPEDLHCVFYYYDGCIAIVASSSKAYTMAIELFCDKYVTDGKICLNDTLKEHVKMSENEYKDYCGKKIFAHAAEKKESNAKKLDALLTKLDTQRTEIESGKLFGTSTKNIGTAPWGKVNETPIDEHPRLLLNSDTLATVKREFCTDEATNERFRSMIESNVVSECILQKPKTQGYNSTVDDSEIHNFNGEYLEIIQMKALGYLLYDDEYYGYQAIYYLKNYIKTLEIIKIPSDQCREYGSLMYTAAIVYDWCYPLLNDVDKEQIIAGIENRVCRMTNEAGAAMEVGFPPSKQGSFTGHGSERQVLRDYLAFSVAIYGDNNSWWDYVASRVYNIFVPPRNYYYQSGIVHQGTGYIQGRYVSDLFSAWILLAATGSQPYENMVSATRGLAGLEFAPGKLFNDGDKTGDYQSASGYVSIFYMTAYLFGDETLLAKAEAYTTAAFSSNINYLTSVAFIALRGMTEDISPSDNIYEGMDLIQYNGAPLGQYVVRNAWNTEDAAAIIMRVKERNTGNHEHGDSGTFEIYYKGVLTSDGGCYNNYGHFHTRYFHQSTISHNGLIIFEPSKWDFSSTNNAVKWYSGSQRKPGEPKNLSDFQGSVFETGKVLAKQHEYNKDGTPLYVYIAGEISKAYETGAANYVGRSMLTVYTGDAEYPMVFFVYDDITTPAKTTEKRFLLQISAKEAPTVDGSAVITENGGGRLVLTCLSNDVTINAVGGRCEGSYTSETSFNYAINGQQCMPKSVKADDGHWGRIEISARSGQNDASFMNVLYVTDAGNTHLAKVAAISDAIGVEGGVFNGKTAALFATERGGAKEKIGCNIAASGNIDYYVAGLSAGEWRVSVDGKACGTYTASADGGLLTFTAPAGVIEISPVN